MDIFDTIASEKAPKEGQDVFDALAKEIDIKIPKGQESSAERFMTNYKVKNPKATSEDILMAASDNFNITGFNHGTDGKKITIMNGTGFEMNILPENGGSLSENRIYGKDTITIKSKEIVNIIYDNDEKRWIVI